ncbi:MAG: nitronate monooxygenase, partial [Acidimicrobiaceae bacterium]|nr:nitronate monooxygenase [Acidimicrobiaceae bacterium]
MGAAINRPGAGRLGGKMSARSQVIGADPFGRSAPELVVAVSRAGALGVLDVDGPDWSRAIDEVRARTTDPFAIRAGGARLAEPNFSLPAQVDTIVLAAGAAASRLPGPVADGRTVLATVRSQAESLCAMRAGADGLIAKGAESGGLVGNTEAFVFLQQLLAAHPGVPIWVQGGIGLYTAAAAVAAGAHGVVLDSQLALARETRLDGAVRQAIRSMDGSETRVVGDHRVYTRPDLPAARISADVSSSVVAGQLGTDIERQLLPIGQDAAAASVLADRFVSAGGIVTAIRRQIHDQIFSARAIRPLAAGHGVADTFATRYPIAQGPMTRVSDCAAFAAAVADAGGLPFLALALLRRDEVRVLLEETSALLGERPWGVGILGFVPPELREEQL